MFKDKMYLDLRENMELYERERKEGTWNSRSEDIKEAWLCQFLKNEKNKDIRIAIRSHRLALVKNENELGSLLSKQSELDEYKRDILDYLEKHQDVKRAVEESLKWGEPWDLNKLNDAGDIILQSRDNLKKDDPYIKVYQAYLDYLLKNQERFYIFKQAEEICDDRKNCIVKDVKTIVKQVVKGVISADSLSENEFELLVKEILAAVLFAQAKAFLYDVGYPLNNDLKKKSAKEGSKRRQNQILDLVELYLKKNAAALAGENGISATEHNSKEFKNHCRDIYSLVEKEKGEDVFLPLFIDGNTGAGIYILGNNCLGKDILNEGGKRWEKANKNKNWKQFKCHFSYVHWDELLMGGFEENSISLFAKAYGDDIDAAINKYNKSTELSYAVFTEKNGLFFNGMDEKYKLYFWEDEYEEDEEIDLEEYNKRRAFDIARGRI